MDRTYKYLRGRLIMCAMGVPIIILWAILFDGIIGLILSVCTAIPVVFIAKRKGWA